ncbi:MAG: MBL fold metallo-hydrolase [Hespellia sp.]|nr:MBL fold metallo-hydrolase [Hespellia sp.]
MKRTKLLCAFCITIVMILGMVGCGKPDTTANGSTTADTAESESEPTLTEDNWYDGIPFESWSQFEKVDTDFDWYDVYKVPGDIYAIACNGQWELDICYLVLGEDKALLLDTGLGLGDLKSLVESLTDLPITVVVSHSHYDHIGNAHQFDDVWCYNSPSCIETLTDGIPHDDFAYELEDGMIARDIPKDIDLDTYSIEGSTVTNTLNDGDIIDLGNRKLEVLWTPGHTSDSITLIDSDNGILFTGDTYYPDDLYAFSEDSDLAEYTKSMEKIRDRIADLNLKWIYPGHNEIINDINIINEVTTDLEAILNGEKTDYEIGEENYRYYDFANDIRIITLDEEPQK